MDGWMDEDGGDGWLVVVLVVLVGAVMIVTLNARNERRDFNGIVIFEYHLVM
jgi:hypothetical protein